MKTLRLISFAGLAVLASCQSMSTGVLSLEARALVLNDSEVKDIQNGSGGDADVDVEGYGLHAAFMTPIVDLLGGVEQRKFEDEDSPELILGVRRRFLEIWRVHPFVEGNVRYGLDLDNGQTSEDYFGWQIGFGALLDITDHLFLNARVMWDTTSVDVAGGGSTDVEGMVGTIGIGYSF